MTKSRILVIEDDPDGQRSVVEAIEDGGFEAIAAGTGKEGLKLFREGDFDSVLSDLVLPDIDGIEVLAQIKKIDSQMPVLIMTAYGSISSSVKAIKGGAYDYITKPLDLDDLQSKIARAVETRHLRKEVLDLQKSIHSHYTATSIIAKSPGMMEIIRQIGALADTNATVLISGESGTGKELVARALHVDSKRSTGPFVAVNCGAFAESLLESQLFGHEKGAFTGATNQHKGAFERADGGTLFLDEIGDAPKSVQIKLLRVLEEREILRVGGHTPFHIDVRLISASNKDLDELIESGEFREDLLYRLKVVTLHIPPLRQRREDIKPLAERFIAAASEEHGRYIASVEPSFYEKLESYDWPGNVRQLQNVIESSVIMAREPVLRTPLLSMGIEKKRAETGFSIPEGMSFSELEKEILSQLLSRYEGNRTLTAEKLGISRRTIQRKIKEHNLPY
ncbi:MAG: sigma-54 dependent transcriptional regulator [Kiritimatiellae bacterium]|nr:sigma-54 dependent transcriptional regulator [Kiritimatiellia bacterium]